MGGFRDQKQAADEKDQILSGNLLSDQGEKRGGETYHPGERQKQNHPHYERQRESDVPGTCLLLGRQLAGKYRDKYYVVDAEDKLEYRKRCERDPDVRVTKPFHQKGLLHEFFLGRLRSDYRASPPSGEIGRAGMRRRPRRGGPHNYESVSAPVPR